MMTDELLIIKAKKLIEARLGWGDSADWTNQDFIALSEKFRESLDVSISHVTLKRLWGKVKYDGLPQTYTLNALAVFAGYESWRDFKVKNGNGLTVQEEFPKTHEMTDQHIPDLKRKIKFLKPLMLLVIILIPVVGIFLFVRAAKKKIDPRDYTLSIHKVLQAGIPNSVIFDFNAGKAPGDSVVLQQSWDTTRRTMVQKDQHQHTLIYYFPGFFKPKLVVGGEVVQEQDLLLPSDGWLTAVNASPVPVYFNKKDVFADGKMSLSVEKLKAQNIALSPQAPLLSYCNVQDFGEIYADHFSFETSLRNDYSQGSGVCQMTNIYLLCEGTAIGIPLCAKGCESSLNFFFAGYNVSGKQKDLSAFGVDFNEFVRVRVESQNGKARIYLNDRFVYEVPDDISHAKIIGIDFTFQGTGSVDYVRLTNGIVRFEDEF
jgi:hypothetical protein